MTHSLPDVSLLVPSMCVRVYRRKRTLNVLPFCSQKNYVPGKSVSMSEQEDSDGNSDDDSSR